MNDIASLSKMETKIGEIGEADIVVGILCKNVETTILHVLNAVNEGLHRYFPDYENVIVVSDGFSSDRTVELANLFQVNNGIKKVVTEDMVKKGKGAGIKTIFQAANIMNAKMVILLDGDLLSIKPEWIYEFAAPVLYGRTDLVVPYYIRDKYDGVITNNLVYPFTRALYGIDIRQPIAGEYSLSKRLYKMLMEHPLFPLDFGIDIFIVTSAAANRMKIMEGLFSIKIHESTTRYMEPEDLLIPMFKQVTGSMFEMAKYYENFWKGNGINSSRTHLPPFHGKRPLPVKINLEKMMDYFYRDFSRSKAIIEYLLPKELMKKLSIIENNIEKFDGEIWSEVVYNFAAHYKNLKDEREKKNVLNALESLWLGRFVSYAMKTRDMDITEAEEIIEEQARIFEEKKKYLLSIY